jgi:hypothetical protein
MRVDIDELRRKGFCGKDWNGMNKEAVWIKMGL